MTHWELLHHLTDGSLAVKGSDQQGRDQRHGGGTSNGVIKGAGPSKGQGTQEHTQTVGCSPASSQLPPPLSHLQ